MKHKISTTIVISILLSLSISVYAQDFIHHEMKLALQPKKHTIEVEDTISVPFDLLSKTGGMLTFALHSGLNPVLISPIITLSKIDNRRHDNETDEDSFIRLEYYTVSLPEGTNKFSVRYKGEIYHPLEQQEEEYARSFSITPGLISGEGTFLSGGTFWYPTFNDDLITFSIDILLPEGWKTISQGDRTSYVSDSGDIHFRWESHDPQEEIYLISGKLIEYSRQAGPVKALIFLHEPDEELADKYLTATSQYIDMYSELIGIYPYKKFALVENFWETGYGMPSFTLLGPKIIRFPFILHSSYPHEILHNWWGNSVYIDFPKGNWAEGLTAYLSDHLIKEQQGNASEYRRNVLQKYTDFVKEGKDFPITEFRSRHSSATEAVGYGKTLMFFHMLRLQMGDEAFSKALQTFYRDNKFKRASFDDIRNAFEKVTGYSLKVEFDQWIRKTGAPELLISNVDIESKGDKYILDLSIRQVQDGPPYRIFLPIVVYMKGHEEPFQTRLFMNNKLIKTSIKLDAAPLRIDVDPEFDVFRRLDRDEIPPALSKAFGSDKVVIVLPASADKRLLQAYKQLGKSWTKSQTGQIEIKLDNELAELPPDRTIWLLGWENRFLNKAIDKLAEYDVTLTDIGVQIGHDNIKKDNNSIVLTAHNPSNPDFSLSWIATDNPSAIPGLGRKLPHYGKYSFLVFEGDDPSNILKGQWPTLNSPMSVLIEQTVNGEW